jgi:hypothetical protein
MCIRDDPGWLPMPRSVRYHALALSLRVGGGTILPTRRRRGRSTPAPAALDGPCSTDRVTRGVERMLRLLALPRMRFDGGAHAEVTVP